jgi:hypothetical protein
MDGIKRAAIGVALLAWVGAAEKTWVLEPGLAPVDNPLKGLVPYAEPVEGRFPHSMEFFYLPLSSVVKGRGKYDWTELERRLGGIAGRGRQAVFRPHLEYPGETGVIPAYLVDGGLKVHRYRNPDAAPSQESETPDYEDPRLRTMLAEFIAAFGKRYDGDPRIGFITAGLLGAWGEWHTHPREDLFASKAVQREVMDAYERAFKVTPVLLRYPAGEGHGTYEANAGRRFGYHDDSFAWATLGTGRKEDGWFFVPLLKAAGADGQWRTRPIGGEIRPEAWGRVFDEPVAAPVQDFRRCVEETRVSWLMDSGMFRETATPERLARASAAVRRMGYEFRVTTVTKEERGDEGPRIRVTLVNQGVAPFYHPWKVWFRLLDGRGKPLGPDLATEHSPQGLLPGESVTWEQRLGAAAGRSDPPRVLMQVRNPLPGGAPIRFANASQDREEEGWLSLTPGAAE